MNRFPRQLALAAAALLVAATGARAQRAPRIPHVGYIYPTGGQRNTSFEVTIGGQYLNEANETYLSGEGVSLEIVKHYKPFSQGDVTSINRKLDEARDKLEEEWKKQGKTGKIPLDVVAKAAGVTEDDFKEIEIYRKRQADPKRQPNSQIEEELTVKVTIAPDAPLGKRELRIISPGAMSNPIWFFVEQWEERYETEPNDDHPDPTIGSTFPVVVNGQIFPGDVDRFSFTARKGMRLVMSVSARELMPYLADAVPGWFQAVLVLYDSKGDELVYAGAYYYRQDPVIYYEVPEDGEYSIEIRDSIYRGREDFVYRITIGELPFVTGIFPLGARAGTEVKVELQGWNLVNTDLTVNAHVNRNYRLRWYEIPQTDEVSIRFPLRIDMASEVLDQEPNDTVETAQEVSMPIIINGRIDKPDDRDLFRFEGHGTVVAEVLGRRAGSPIDSAISLTDSTGKELAFNDDYWDKSEPLITHHADSRVMAPLSGKGPFTLHLSDAQRKGGEDFIYRLYLRPPVPDFELRVVPSCIIARPGATVPITVHAMKDYYDGDIEVALVDPPEGFELHGAVVPADQEKVRMTLKIPPTAIEEAVLLEMDGHSVRGRSQRVKISRPAIPAESMMQAFLWLQVVPAEQWAVLVSGRKVDKPPVEFPATGWVELKHGDTTEFAARVTQKGSGAQQIIVDLSEPPEGIKLEEAKVEGETMVVKISTDAEAVEAGMRGNLIFEAFREWTPAPTEAEPEPEPRRSSYGYLPAVPFEVKGKPTRRR